MILRGLLKTAELGIGVARQEAKAAVSRAVQQAAFALVTLTFLFVALCFGLSAFTVWLAREIGTVSAFGVMALVFAVLALIVYGVSRAAANRDRPKRRHRRARREAEEEEARSYAEPESGSTVASLAVVFLVGFTLAQQLFRRR
ncbi:hypothetical protein [Bauldia sp.]|uniref:hypothetical protein n=1 Tax=Bauldia sp. TaxID=2575872 RepID=UPI003BA8F074